MMHDDPRYGPPRPDAVGRLMRAHPFALLVTPTRDEPWFTHLPVLVDGPEERPTRLRLHVARINPHWRHFANVPRSTVVFQGPHSYVSPMTYTAPRTRAPTWNYAVVHAHGPIALVEDTAEIDRMLRDLAESNERGWPQEWDMDAYDPARLEALRPMIVAFTLDIERLDVRFKLNQHNGEADRRGAIDGLKARSDDGARGVAALMQETLDGAA